MKPYSLCVSEAIAQFLDRLEAELLNGAERHGPLRGQILREQRLYSDALDRVVAEREKSAL